MVLNQILSQHLTLWLSSKPTMIVWSDIHHYYTKGFFKTRTTFQCPYSNSHDHYFLVDWASCLGDGNPFFIPFYGTLGYLYHDFFVMGLHN
jgi:hypothetical protein